MVGHRAYSEVEELPVMAQTRRKMESGMTEQSEGRLGCGQLRKGWLRKSHENSVSGVKLEMPQRLPDSNTDQAGKTGRARGNVGAGGICLGCPSP